MAQRRDAHAGYHLSFYEALYVALAESLDCDLITADRRIARALGDHDLVRAITATS